MQADELVQRLIRMRKDGGVTQKQLGDRLGWSQRGVSFRELGKQPFTVADAQAYAAALGQRLEISVHGERTALSDEQKEYLELMLEVLPQLPKAVLRTHMAELRIWREELVARASSDD